MDKESIEYTYNEILLRLHKEENSAIFNYMDKPGKQHAKWNKTDTIEQIQNITYKSKIVTLPEEEFQMVIDRGWGQEEMKSY